LKFKWDGFRGLSFSIDTVLGLLTLAQGKSLSLICAAMTWLRTHKRRQYELSLEAIGARCSDEPPWIVAQMLRRKREDLLREWEERENRLAKLRVKEKELEQRCSKRRCVEDRQGTGQDEEAMAELAEFLLDDWEQTEEDGNDWEMSQFSKETRSLMDKIGMGPPKKENGEDDALEDEIKVRGQVF
jgi:chromosome transmission fidelity protein 1